ncbi:FAD-dependent oxidoreductase [Actinopolymorpha pittospori]|uniref:NADPH-dependent 2,4-dienoyl-CoA reductase/sulfur reductase-like enzyme n=1 Tax=Actinopolymorpha pittospori TaxID=648752 RepID=A0A927N1F3_9ACTN|nr:NADPH-dependent 2,4-dienoyl-CoA reductase/sulfur reductase-like enzyme [Actinopolymorpha pittospori]
MSAESSVLVVGASAAGLGVAEALRRKGHRGAVTVLGAEPHQPYDRPPLSKQILAGDWTPERAWLRPPAALAALDVDFVLGDRALALDPKSRSVHTESGRTLCADSIVVATGLAPRTLPGQENLAGVHVLRTFDDALALRSALPTCSRLVVVGEGVLAAEIAATARKLGVTVAMTGPQPAPLAAQLGPLAAGLLAELHAERGVSLRLGTAASGLAGGDGRVTGVRLATGEVLPADLVVVAVGAAPVTDWLAGSGLCLDNGVVCDSRCQAARGIYAAGDVARWHHEGLDDLVRLENRTNATEQAVAVAANILGADLPYKPVPYLWTDQYDTRIQVFGTPRPEDDVTVVDGAVGDRRFVALCRRDGAVTGVLGWNMPKQTRLRRQELLVPAPRTSGMAVL